jgi:hypothetical protein
MCGRAFVDDESMVVLKDAVSARLVDGEEPA